MSGRMQLGISTYTYGWAVGTPDNRPAAHLNEQALLDRAKAFGIGLVQFGDNLPLHDLSTEQLEALYQRALEAKIDLEVGARGLTVEHLERYVEIALRVDAHLLRFVIDRADYEPPVDDVVSLLKEASPLLHRHRITLALENHDRLKAREFARIIERVGSDNVGICLDSVNSMGAGEGLEEVVETLAPYTVNLHLKDFGIERLPHQMGFQIDGRPAGQGMLNVPWLVEQVGQYGRCQTAILEQWVVPEEDIRETILKEQRWAEESLAYLRTLTLFTDNSLTLHT